MIRRMIVSTVLAVSVVTCSWIPSYAARPAPLTAQATRAQVEQLLSGYEYLPSRTDLDQVGVGVADRLVEIVMDQGALNVHRMRAIKLLAQYAEQPSVHRFLGQFLDRQDQPFAYRRAALLALGAVPGGQSVDRLAGFVQSSDLQVRSAAAQALASTKHQRAAWLLKQAALIEHDPALRQKFEHLAQMVETGQ